MTSDRRLDPETIRREIATAHEIAIAELTSDDEGVDSAARSYRATATDGSAWFVKVRREVRPAAILVPRYLAASGLPEVVASLPPRSGEPWLAIGPWSVLVSPLVPGSSALRAGMDLAGWQRLGAFAARLHHVHLPAELAALVPRETFLPRSTALAREVARWIAGDPGDRPDDLAAAVVRRWRAERATILHLADRVDELAGRIRTLATPPRPVLCHADLHTANILVEPNGGLRVVDWDELTFAPAERDLVFIRGAAVTEIVSEAQADAFERGYGSAAGDPLLIAYYRMDWAVQDIAGFARDVLLDSTIEPRARARAARLFEGQFDPGGEVEAALAAEAALEHADRINDSQSS